LEPSLIIIDDLDDDDDVSGVPVIGRSRIGKAEATRKGKGYIGRDVIGFDLLKGDHHCRKNATKKQLTLSEYFLSLLLSRIYKRPPF